MIKKTFLCFFYILIVVVIAAYLGRAQWVGFLAEPRLEAVLQDIFGLDVQIDRLRADPVSGKVQTDHFTFSNPETFSNRFHLEIRHLSFHIDLWALKDRHVLISNVVFEKPDYLIERILSEGEP